MNKEALEAINVHSEDFSSLEEKTEGPVLSLLTQC